MLTRRELMLALGYVTTESYLSYAFGAPGSETDAGWVKYKGNPVLGGQYGTCFDICVLREMGKFRMWVSWRPKKSVAITESADGVHW